MFERVRLTRLFQSFQAHYGFEYVFCNAYAGHEKGGVESRVGAVRRKLFVPVPSVRGHAGVQRQAARAVPRAGRQGPLPQGRSRDGPVRRGPQSTAGAAGDTLRRGHVEKHEGRQVRDRHRRGQAPVRGRPRACGARADRRAARVRGRAARCLRGPHHDASARLRRQPHQQRRPVPADRAAVQQARGLAQQPGPRGASRPAARMARRAGARGPRRGVAHAQAGRTRERMGERGGGDGRDPRDHRRHRPRRRMPGRGPTRRRDRARRLRRARRPDADTTWRSPGGRTTHEPEERGAHGHRPAAGEGPRPVHLPSHHRRPAGLGHATAAPGRRQAAAHGTGATARPRSAPGSCAAPGSPSPRRWTATTSRT